MADQQRLNVPESLYSPLGRWQDSYRQRHEHRVRAVLHVLHVPTGQVR